MPQQTQSIFELFYPLSLMRRIKFLIAVEFICISLQIINIFSVIFYNLLSQLFYQIPLSLMLALQLPQSLLQVSILFSNRHNLFLSFKFLLFLCPVQQKLPLESNQGTSLRFQLSFKHPDRKLTINNLNSLLVLLKVNDILQTSLETSKMI